MFRIGDYYFIQAGNKLLQLGVIECSDANGTAENGIKSADNGQTPLGASGNTVSSQSNTLLLDYRAVLLVMAAVLGALHSSIL